MGGDANSSRSFFENTRELAPSPWTLEVSVVFPFPASLESRSLETAIQPFLAGLAENCFKFRADQNSNTGQTTKQFIFFLTDMIRLVASNQNQTRH